MKKWTYKEAIVLLHREKAVQVLQNGTKILRIPPNGFSGLSACSAYDYVKGT